MDIKFDLHTHHERCGHADGSIEQYIRAAIKEGLTAIGISDHAPYFAHEHDQPRPNIAMAKREFPHYVREVLALKQKYADKIDVLLGVESDFYAEHIDTYRHTLTKYPFDYIIGSVHQTNGVSIFNRHRFDHLSMDEQIQQKTDYYTLIEQSARSGLFQILGHIDAMKAYYPAFSDIPTPDVIDRTLKTIADHNVAIEVNTSGGTKKVGGWYPSDAILERALYFNVSITFGSDAHHPRRVAEDFARVQQRLQEIGFKQWVYFKQLQPVIVKL